MHMYVLAFEIILHLCFGYYPIQGAIRKRYRNMIYVLLLTYEELLHTTEMTTKFDRRNCTANDVLYQNKNWTSTTWKVIRTIEPFDFVYSIWTESVSRGPACINSFHVGLQFLHNLSWLWQIYNPINCCVKLIRYHLYGGSLMLTLMSTISRTRYCNRTLTWNGDL